MRIGPLLVLTSALLAGCGGKSLPVEPEQAPDTEIISGPETLSNQATARFTFSSTVDGSQFLCVIDTGDPLACASPWTTKPGDGVHHLVVTAVAPNGLSDPTPATFDWSIDTVAPSTRLTSGPNGITHSSQASFLFEADDADAGFECQLDDAGFDACASPLEVDGISPGEHLFQVAAMDPAGNVDPTPERRSWTVSDGGTFHLRIMSANLTSGNDQSYDPGDGERIFEGLKPDVVMIQEFKYLGTDGQDSDQDVRGFVDQAFGTGFSFYREPESAAISLPNGVISRYPILDGGQWTDESPTSTTPFNRSFVWAEIDLPGPKNLWAVSLHLKSGSKSDDQAQRDTEAQEIVADVEANVPAGDYLVIGGDFNTYSRDPAQEAALGDLASIVVTPGATGTDFPVDQSGDGGTSSKRNHPYDWVLAAPALDALQVDTTFPSGNDFPDGLVFDSRVYTPLSDVSPVELGDSAALNMQHMGVVKDFELPAQ